MTTGEFPIGQRRLHDQLALLRQKLLAMSARAEALVALAVEALLERDAAKAQAVIAGDEEVDLLELETEELAVSILALQQPLARDLRFLIGAIKVASDLERVGDHAVNIAQSTERLLAQPVVVPIGPELPEMARRARAMLSDALDAFVREDGALGRRVCRADDEVDALHDSIFRIMLTRMMSDPRTINAALEFLLASRNLERVADLATNIGEDAVYIAEGTTIKHRADQMPPDAPPAAGGPDA
jgi:phosphate transport system protein